MLPWIYVERMTKRSDIGQGCTGHGIRGTTYHIASSFVAPLSAETNWYELRMTTDARDVGDVSECEACSKKDEWVI